MDRDRIANVLKTMTEKADTSTLRKGNIKAGLPEDTPMEIGVRITAERGKLQGFRDHSKLIVESLIRSRSKALQYECDLPDNIFADDSYINAHLLERVLMDYPEPSEFDRFLRKSLGLSENAPLVEYLKASIAEESQDPFKEYNRDLLERVLKIISECDRNGTDLPETVLAVK